MINFEQMDLYPMNNGLTVPQFFVLQFTKAYPGA